MKRVMRRARSEKCKVKIGFPSWEGQACPAAPARRGWVGGTKHQNFKGPKRKSVELRWIAE